MASVRLKANAQLQLADHIWSYKKGYTHHGIYIGENEHGEPLVVHYAGLIHGFHGGPLEITTLDDFAADKSVRVRQYKKRQFSRSETLDRVFTRLGEEAYDPHSNNCEHFCQWAIMGEHRSNQVDWVDTLLGAIHPGLEAASRSIHRMRQPDKEAITTHHNASNIARDLAIDWGLKSAARWVAGPIGVVAYVGYRVTKQVIQRR